MTDHIHGEDSYVECDRFYVVNVVTHEEHDEGLPEKFHYDVNCYCGADATHYARVAFYTVIEEREEWWDRTLTQTLKAHRCDEHKFETEDEH